MSICLKLSHPRQDKLDLKSWSQRIKCGTKSIRCQWNMKLKELERVGRRPGSRFIYSGLVSCPTVHRHPAILTIPNILLQLHKPLFHSFNIHVLVAHAGNIFQVIISTTWSILTCFQACAEPWMKLNILSHVWLVWWDLAAWIFRTFASIHLCIYVHTQ